MDAAKFAASVIRQHLSDPPTASFCSVRVYSRVAETARRFLAVLAATEER